MYLTSQYASPVGELTLCSQEDRLAGLWPLRAPPSGRRCGVSCCRSPPARS